MKALQPLKELQREMINLVTKIKMVISIIFPFSKNENNKHDLQKTLPIKKTKKQKKSSREQKYTSIF